MYREVTMVEVKEVLRLWREGVPTKRLAAQLGLDPKTVRRYLRAAAATGLRAEPGVLTDDHVRDVLLALQRRIVRIKAVPPDRVYRRSLIGRRSPVVAVFDSSDAQGAGLFKIPVDGKRSSSPRL